MNFNTIQNPNTNNYRFKIRYQKKKIFVVDGFVSYQLTVHEHYIYCPCNKSNKNINTPLHHSSFCGHILFFLEESGLDLCLLKFWKKIGNLIISDILKSKYVDSSILWNIIEEQIFNSECGFCLEKLFDKNEHFNENNIYICQTCQGVTHTKCFEQWNKKNNSCMLCRG